ncbi:hypothetical protein Anas_13784 [Armadillidium nasatum]|uniref:LITAF domain-containing protein n=1 Tax=Armadillidium nasatum TaxID=96803 RepID=A0A5N5SNY5_9CRUS|nr:hypothetical protein Anas_13784 [Armadillidium nasatum]
MSNPVEDFVLDENSKVGRRDDDVIFTLQAKGNNNNAPSIGKFFEGDKEHLLPKEPMKSSRTKMTCPRCQTEMMSKTKNENSIATYLFCCLICVTGVAHVLLLFPSMLYELLQESSTQLLEMRSVLGALLPTLTDLMVIMINM